jgi:YHS domain-containing protein
MPTRRVYLAMLASVATTGIVSGLLRAQAQNLQGQNRASPPERLALKGYDPVAYFTDLKPVPGVAEFEYAWDGQRYRFATAQHLQQFKANPEKYAPQFGGSCAMNMANGVRRESDPHNWVISDGHLYVFAGQAGAETFRKDPSVAAQRANANWKSMKATATQ